MRAEIIKTHEEINIYKFDQMVEGLRDKKNGYYGRTRHKDSNLRKRGNK